MPRQNWIHIPMPGARRAPAPRFVLEAIDLLERGRSPEDVRARMVERGFTPEDAAELVGGLFEQGTYDDAVDRLNGGLSPDEAARQLAAARGLERRHAEEVVANLLARPSWRRSKSGDLWDRIVGALILVGVVAVLGGGWFAYALWDDAAERGRLRELNEKNRWVQGRVTDVSRGSRSSDRAETVRFVYSVDGEEYEGKETRWAWGGSTRVGAPIEVLYHPDRPKLHRTSRVPEKELTFSWGRFAEERACPACFFVVLAVAGAAVKLAMRGAGGPPPHLGNAVAPGGKSGQGETGQVVGDGTPPPVTPGTAVGKVALGKYVFEEEPGRLTIRTGFGDHVAWLIVGAVLACGGVAGSVALVLANGPSWWLLGTGAAAALGGWTLSRTLVLGRTVWTFDRAADALCRRGRVLRPLSSIKQVTVHLTAIYDHTRGEYDLRTYCVGFAPDLAESAGTMEDPGMLAAMLGAYRELWRKDVVVIPDAKEAAQAAKFLGAFLGVEVVSQGLE